MVEMEKGRRGAPESKDREEDYPHRPRVEKLWCPWRPPRALSEEYAAAVYFQSSTAHRCIFSLKGDLVEPSRLVHRHELPFFLLAWVLSAGRATLASIPQSHQESSTKNTPRTIFLDGRRALKCPKSCTNYQRWYYRLEKDLRKRNYNSVLQVWKKDPKLRTWITIGSEQWGETLFRNWVRTAAPAQMRSSDTEKDTCLGQSMYVSFLLANRASKMDQMIDDHNTLFIRLMWSIQSNVHRRLHKCGPDIRWIGNRLCSFVWCAHRCGPAKGFV